MSEEYSPKPNQAPSTRSSPKPVEGMIDQAASVARSLIGEATDQATTTASELGGRARDAYDRAAEATKQAADVVDPFVRDRPYVTLGLAAALGLVTGLLLAGSGTRTVYVRGGRVGILPRRNTVGRWRE